jgi:hypothetical protein
MANIADNGTKLGKATYAAKVTGEAAEIATNAVTATLEAKAREAAANITNSMLMAMRKEAAKQGVGSAFYGENADGAMREMVFGQVFSVLLDDAKAKTIAALSANKEPV